MKKCDLVMKGGITSGIVYPGAVVELSKEFRFVNIGGTSAGAIAAALTAAAEHRRQSDNSTAGFEQLAQLPKYLGESEGGRSRLLGLFRASDDTAPLFDVALAWLETTGSNVAKGFATFRALAKRFNRYGSMALSVAALMIAVAIASAWMLRDRAPIVAIGAVLSIVIIAAIAAIAFAIGAAVEMAMHASRALPKNGFGLCSGADGLTEWLADRIDEVAGTSHALTFGDLEKIDVHLEMMTTNLTHGRPYRLPMETRTFFFSPKEFRALFPKRVVEQMIAAAPQESRTIATPDGETLVRFPSPDQLPVVVATRMSLSFPILLSALPLWTIDFARRDAAHHAERCWFSDGGITSNFPVHFFDSPLPRWPTFAINLAPRSPRYHEEGQRIYVPQSNRGGIHEWFTPFATLGGFLGAIIDTMQNWRDNMLLHLPGQRDRIAHVLLAENEGGLNLTMPRETIEDVARRGAEAGASFRARYDKAWPNHRWIRFLAFMASLEGALERWTTAFDESLFDAPPPSYKVSPEERRAMREAAIAFHAHVRQNFGAKPFRKPVRRPRPEAVLRAMARE